MNRFSYSSKKNKEHTTEKKFGSQSRPCVTEQAAAEENADPAEENAVEDDMENSSTRMGRMKRIKKRPSWMKDCVI